MPTTDTLPGGAESRLFCPIARSMRPNLSAYVRNRARATFGALLVGLALGACGRSDRLTDEQVQASRSASASLHRLAAAAQAGTSAIEYNRLLATTVADVDPALRSLPAGPLVKLLSDAQQRFVDAQSVWARKIRGEEGAMWVNANSPFGADLRKRTCDVQALWSDVNDGAEWARADDVIWYLVHEGAALTDAADSALVTEGHRVPTPTARDIFARAGAGAARTASMQSASAAKPVIFGPKYRAAAGQRIEAARPVAFAALARLQRGDSPASVDLWATRQVSHNDFLKVFDAQYRWRSGADTTFRPESESTRYRGLAVGQWSQPERVEPFGWVITRVDERRSFANVCGQQRSYVRTTAVSVNPPIPVGLNPME